MKKTVFLDNLKKLPEELNLTIDERLPEHIIGPVNLICDWRLEDYEDYYALSLNIAGDLNIQCQSCCKVFSIPFKHHNTLALCKHAKMLDALMPKMDCLLLEEMPENLVDIVTDELHLYTPEKHLDACA